MRDRCDQGFTQKNNLTTHQRVHTGDKPCVCDTCDKGFKTEDRLKRHQRVHTKRTPEIVLTSSFLLSRYCLNVQKAT